MKTKLKVNSEDFENLTFNTFDNENILFNYSFDPDSSFFKTHGFTYLHTSHLEL